MAGREATLSYSKPITSLQVIVWDYESRPNYESCTMNPSISLTTIGQKMMCANAIWIISQKNEK
jgi:hypothetical protein